MSAVTVSDSFKTVPELEAIYREHAPLVYRTAWGVLGNREDAEDVLQVIFLKLLRRDFPPDLEKNPKAYLYRAAVNVSLDALKTRRRRPAVVIDDAERLEARDSSSDSAFDESLNQRLYEGIARLSPEGAEVLLLRYMQNRSIAEIAKTLGVSRTVVAVRLFRARVRLKHLIQSSQEKTS